MASQQDIQQKLMEKERELQEIYSTFQEIKTAYETLNIQMQKKELELETLKSQLQMKETQLTTISGIIKSKDELIESLKATLKLKEEQILALEEAKKAIEEGRSESVSKEQAEINEKELEEKDLLIKQLKEEIKLLNLDLEASDEEVESLHKQIQELKLNESQSQSASTSILTSNATRDEIIDFIVEIIGRSLHNVTLTTPTISDLGELSVYDVKASVNIKATCYIDPSNQEHTELLEEFNALDNINLRNFEDQDRWICLKDNEELFIAAVGENENNLAFYTKDPKHIKLFNALIMESWLRARKL